MRLQTLRKKMVLVERIDHQRPAYASYSVLDEVACSRLIAGGERAELGGVAAIASQQVAA